MRKQGSTITQRVVAVVMSVVMAFSLLVASPREAEAGIMPASLTSALGKVALSAVKGSLVWGLGELADATPNDAMATVFSTTRALIAGKQRVLAEQTIEMMEELTAELDALFDYTLTSTRDIEKMIKSLTQNDAKDAFQEYAGTPVDTFTYHYKGIVAEFNDLMKAFSVYNEDPSEDNRDKLERCYNNIYEKYFKGKDYAKLNEQLDKEFISPLSVSIGGNETPSFLSLISPYDPTMGIDESSDLTDPDSDSWQLRGSASGDATYLSYYRRYIDQITNFQNNVYGSMSDAATLVSNAAYLYLQAYRYFCEFQAVLFASDSSLSEDDMRSQTSAMWNDYYENALKTIRAINQMYYAQEDVFTTYMRTSDVADTRRIQDWKNPCAFDQMLKDYEAANNYEGIRYMEHAGVDYHTPTTKQYLKDFQEYQHIYQFRLVSDPSNVYAIRTSTGMDDEGNPIAEHDGISQAFPVRDMVTVMPGGGLQDQTGPSFDLLTSLKGLEGGFIVPVEMKELSAIADGSITSYDTSDTLVGNIKYELSMTLGGKDNVHLPEIEFQSSSTDEDAIKYGPNIMPLRRTVYWTMDYSLLENPDAQMSLGSASMPYSTGNEGFYDLEDDLRDYTGYKDDKHLQNSEAVVMWYCKNPSSSVTLTSSEGGTTSVEVGDDGALSSGQSGTFDPGTAMTIRAEPQEGYTISSVQLVDENGNPLEDLLSNVTFEDGTTITTQEMLQVTSPNAGDAYEFSVPVPCKDATVKVDYAPIDKSLLQYDVTLNDVKGGSGYDAVCQFGSYDFLGKKSFKAGEQVIVSVVGYDHHVSKALTITDAAGQAVDVVYEDVSDAMMRTRPTERLYAFNMPEQDVSVTPVLGATNSVTVVTDNAPHVTTKFEGLNLVSFGGDTDWAHTKAVDFEAGDTVSISYAADVTHVVTEIKIVDANYNEVPAYVQEGKIVFTMPNVAVVVSITESTVNIDKRMLTLDSELEGASFQFVEGESLTALTQREYDAGETVRVKASFSPDYSLEGMLLTANGSSENLFDQQGGTYDPETGLVTFAMPDANATLSAAQTKKPCIALDTAIEGARLQFVDDDGNAEEATERYAAAGETVKASVQLTDDALSVESILLTADGGDGENLFEAQGGTFVRSTGMLTFAMPDSNATLSATLQEKTPAETDGFDTDADGRILVHTYADLVNFSNAIRQNPEFYTVQDLVLTNNINANGEAEWEQGIGDYYDDIAYNGTFEGNGYCIFGLRFNISDNAGLFEVLGTDGVVRNLFLYDCDSVQHGQYTGAIAAYNYGRIEYCVSGANLANQVYVDSATGALVSLNDRNSYIYGWGIGSGIAAQNKEEGIIYACRSAAEITANITVGGIAGNSRGIISNCASNASLSGIDTDNDWLGGIASEISRSIADDSYPGLLEGGYSSAYIDHSEVPQEGYLKSTGAGSIVGMHQGEMVDTYYTTSEDQQPFDADAAYEHSETNINGLTRDEMAQDSFVDALNATQSNSVTWIRSNGLNDGLPRIMNESAAFGDAVITSNGVSARGNVHVDANLAVSMIPSDSEAWQLLAAGDDSSKSASAYACDIRDAVGNQIPAELWVQSALTYTVPVSSAAVDVVVMLADGSVAKVDNVEVAKTDSGYEATFTSDYAVAFMVFGEGESPKPDDGLDRDDDGRILIGTYEDLVKFSQLIRLTPADYASADLVLTKNINATGKEAWTQGIGSQVDNVFYNGTFEGNGYCIFGLDISAAGNAALFEVIGEKGMVRNLFLYDCDCQASAQVAGGIAAYNYGRIEQCVNGGNFTNGVFVSPSGQVVSLREYNSVVDANVGGGIVGSNYGTIYACRSAAVVRANCAGSIAGENGGTVSNCAGNGSVGSEATESCDCGGLVGSNGASGVVEAGYSSATIDSSVPNRGNIAGTQLGSIIDTYYTNSEDQLPFEGSADGSTATNVNGVRRGEMMQDSFLQMLDAVSSNSVTWVRNDSLNMGLPRIKNESAAFADVTLVGEGVSVRGNMHVGASMAMTTLASDSEAWTALVKDADGYAAIAAYSCELQDDAGNKIPDELWVQSELTYTVPVPSANVAIKVLCRDGSTRKVDDVKVEKAGEGYAATFSADGVGAIMVLQEDSNSEKQTAAGTTKAGTTTVATRTASTGDRSLPTVLAVLLAGVAVLLVAGGMMWRRRNGTR